MFELTKANARLMKKLILPFVLFLFGNHLVQAHGNHGHRHPRNSRGVNNEAFVELYKFTDFRGEALLIDRDWSCEFDRDFCFNIESIYVPEGFQVYLYEYSDFRGEPIVLDNSWDGLGRNDRFLRNRIRSIRVVKRRQAQPIMPHANFGPQVVVFDEAFGGRQMSINGRWSVNRRDGFAFNDCISAIYVPRGFKVRVYEHANYRGRYMDIYSDWMPRHHSFWNNRISSIEVIPLNPPRTYRRFP